MPWSGLACTRNTCDVEDGPRLAPIHLLHGPGGALLATLP